MHKNPKLDLGFFHIWNKVVFQTTSVIVTPVHHNLIILLYAKLLPALGLLKANSSNFIMCCLFDSFKNIFLISFKDMPNPFRGEKS